MIIKRTLNAANFDRLLKDFGFLLKLIEGSMGTLDLAIRDNYLNLYYRGYSLAKVTFKRDECYEIRAHKDFWKGPLEKHQKIRPLLIERGNDKMVNIGRDLLHPFFQKSHLDRMFSAIKAKGSSEELVFEQMLITDNMGRPDFLIIDRQITDKVFKGRMDLLALRQNEKNSNKYHFVVLEVKMGNNPELAGAVAGQLDRYVRHITGNFGDYKECYEEHYRQKKAYGLFAKPKFSSIEIEGDVEGMVVVGGYSGQAKKALTQLQAKRPGILTQQFMNKIR